MSTPTCSETVNRGSGRWYNPQPCGRPAERDGLCKLHIRVRDKRESKHRAWRESYEAGEQLIKEAEKLSKKLGIPVRAHFDTMRKHSGYDGKFVVPGDWLRKQARGKS